MLDANGLIKFFYDVKNEREQIEFDYKKAINNNDQSMKDIEDIINILNGRNEHIVHKLKEEHVCLKEGEIVYFDDLYDSENISLRAVVVKKLSDYRYAVIHNNFGSFETAKIPIVCGKSSYLLFIIGFAKHSSNRSYDFKDVVKIEHTNDMAFENGVISEHGLIVSNVSNVFSWNNQKDIVEYYNNTIKPLNSRNPTVEYIKYLIDKEKKDEQHHIQIKEQYNLKDFKEILGDFCSNCGKDGLLGVHGFPIKCYHCCENMDKF